MSASRPTSAAKPSNTARSAALAKANAAAGGRKRKKHTDDVNSNTALFLKPTAAVTAALVEVRGGAAASAQRSAVESDEERKESVASIHASLALAQPRMPDARTANGDLSFAGTRCARLDLFYRMVRGAEDSAVSELMRAAWKEEALHTVQLLMHSRDARGGKGEKLISLFGLMWLREHKPVTYVLNIITFLGLGYFKDLLHLAVAVAERGLPPMGACIREDLERKAAAQAARTKNRKSSGASSSSPINEVQHETLELEIMAEYLRDDWRRLQEHNKRMEARRARLKQRAAELGVPLIEEVQEECKEEVASTVPEEERVPQTREEEMALAAKRMAAAEVAADQPSGSEEDSDWEKVDNGAAQASTSDAETSSAAPASATPPSAVASPKRFMRMRPEPHLQLSLAAKWAPSEGSSFDKKHHLAKRLARLVFPGDPQCFRLYREALSACRTHLNVTERHMCRRDFSAIDFEKIPAKCHQLLKAALERRCGARYAEYRAGLKKGTKKINTAGILPADLAAPYITGSISNVDETIEGAWRTLVSKLRLKCSNTGGLASAVAIVDVSGSMTCFNGLPMNVAISLGLLVSELADGPFKGRVITFSERPQWQVVPQRVTLFEQVHTLKRMDWGCSTNLRAVFNLILDTAVCARCPQEDLPQTLFIFSDMQFNSAVRDHDAVGEGCGIHSSIKAKYAAAGYKVPNIVYWNLNGLSHSDSPVDVSTPGMALIGGYSAELLKAFLAGQDIDPINIMMHAIAPYTAVVEDAER